MIGYSLILPLGPSDNNYYKRNRDGSVRVSDAGQAFRREVWLAVKQAKMPKLKGRLAMVVRVCPRDKRKIDINNRLKALGDALQAAGAFEDDEQLDDSRALRGAIVSGGRLEVMLGEIDAKQE